MDSTTVRFRLSGQELTMVGNHHRFASNSVGIVRIEVEPSDEWLDFDSVDCIFQNDQDRTTMTMFYEFGTYACMTPADMLSRISNVFINLSGKNLVDGDLVERLTTYPTLAFIIDVSSNVANYRETVIPANQYEQYIAAVRNEVNRIEEVSASVEDSAAEALNSATSASNSATAALNSATAAHASEQSAEDSADNAAISANLAGQSADNASEYAENASGSATRAASSEASAQTSETNAASYMTAASEYADDSLRYSQNASDSADRAETARNETVAAKDATLVAVEGFETTVETATITAVQSIQNEGSTQVTAVQTKGDEVLDSIPATYTSLSNDFYALGLSVVNGELCVTYTE